MIRRSPCELYIKYLIVRHEKYTDQQIVEQCRAKQLDYIGTFYIRGLRAETVPPVPYYPENRLHSPSFKFNMKHGLSQLFRPDLHMQTASRLLEMPRAKELLEQLLLSRTQLQWIASALTKDGYNASVEAVKCYKRHYFDVDAVDPLEMRTLIKLRMQEGANHQDPEIARVAAAYEKASWSDPRVATTNAPVNQLSTVINGMRLGYAPDQAAFPKLVVYGRMLAVSRAMEAMMINGRNDAQNAAYYAQVSKIFNEISETTGDPSSDLEGKLASLSIQTDQPEVPLLQDISGGNHTGQMEPSEGERHAGAQPTRKKRSTR